MSDNDHNQKNYGYNRRDFLKKSAAAGLGISMAGAALTSCSQRLTAPPEPMKHGPLDKVRIGFVGVGLQGSSHVRNFLRMDNVEVKAVCDIVEWKVRRIQNWVEEAGQRRPEGYFRSKTDFIRLCDRDDLDLVFTATPWRWHVPVCVEAMKKGKHAATEVPAAVTLDECWQLVETSEKTRRYCVMMENCCYSDRAMLILNLVRLGLLGEVLNGECGYLHDLREGKFNGRDEALWRTAHSIKRDGNLYPTHGLGPVAEAMDINRGDSFDYLISMSCNSRGLNLHAAEKFGPDSREAQQKYALGDVNTSLIKTKMGRTITVIHDTNLPRPYSRGDMVQGTQGIIQGYPDRVHIEGMSQPHEWETFESYMEKYRHSLWKDMAEIAKGAGHGGMDFLEDFRLVDALLKGREPDMDVYDAAAWSAVSELSEISVARRGQPMGFPDFTRGAWKANPRIFCTDL
jgi:predicted dehydrogenase